MKTFNAYENLMMQGDVYIKLNEEFYLFVGTFNYDADLNQEFDPASNDQKSPNRIYIRSRDRGDFERRPDWDGLEINISEKYHKILIKKTLEV